MVATAQGLCEFIDASPSPFHVCATVAPGHWARPATTSSPRRTSGRRREVLHGASGITGGLEQRHLRRDRRGLFGSSAAIPTAPTSGSSSIPTGWSPDGRWSRCSPTAALGCNSWLDRDLGVSGRLSVRDHNCIAHRLVRINEPILRIPQLAIHLAEDRTSVTVDPQRHVNAVWGAGDAVRSFVGYVAERTGVIPTNVLGFDLMTHDLTPSRITGVETSSSARPGWTTKSVAMRGWRHTGARGPVSAGAGVVRP